jgi:hypothetical protein
MSATTTTPATKKRRSSNVSGPSAMTCTLRSVPALTGLGLTKVKQLAASGDLRTIVVGGRRLAYLNGPGSVRELVGNPED